MQEKLQPEFNNFFLPEILSLEQQRNRLRCPSNNQANSVCVSQKCSISGLMCLDTKCQCRKIHYRCHHILLDRVLQSVEKHQKQIPQKVKQTYKTIYQMLNQMIERLSKLRTKFQREQQYFGLREQELEFMQLINQNKIDEVNGKIISSLEKTFDVQIQLNKNSKQEIIKDFQIKRRQFEKLCQNIQSSYLQTNQTDKLKSIANLFKDSAIVKKQQQVNLLNKWLCDSVNNPQKILQSDLLFRASQHNFEATKFHQKCDGKRDTLVIVKNEFDKIIGGFTSQPWISCKENKYVKDNTDRAFMFSLNLKQKFKCFSQIQSIRPNINRGPVFGSGYDLYLGDRCNLNQDNSNANITSAYNVQENGNKKYKNNQQTYTLFTGQTNGNKFKVLQYEVYQIKGL